MNTAELGLVGVGRVDGLGDVGYHFGPKVPPLAALHSDQFVKCHLCQFNSELCTTLTLAPLRNPFMV